MRLALSPRSTQMDHDRDARRHLSAGMYALREEEAVLKLVASMIVKNEMGRYLELALDHLLTFCDEIARLDDGSTDGSYRLCQALPQVEVLRNPGPSFFEHEGKARQNLYEWTLRGLPDYVLAIDADEFVTNPDYLRVAMESGRSRLHALSSSRPGRCPIAASTSASMASWGPRKIPILYQIIRQSRHWRIAPKQLACGREPEQVIQRSRRATATGSRSSTSGGRTRPSAAARAQRYYDHDHGKFHQDRHLQSILWDGPAGADAASAPGRRASSRLSSRRSWPLLSPEKFYSGRHAR